jgi:hypothetical protein
MRTSRSLLFILIGCLHASSLFAATGPVPAESLPGGATVVDSDPGAGEAWGRVGGRTFSYSDFVIANFTLLEWQSISAAMSFDGPVNEAGEVMILDSVGPATLVYTGSTMVDLVGGPILGLTPVDTRFTVNLTGATFVGGTPPTVNVLLHGDFDVNVLFEALNPVTSAWGPALDVFDALDTPEPPAEMLANTTFEQGFFFDEVAGLLLSEHDANMQERAEEIVGLLGHLTAEELGHFLQLNANHNEHAENMQNRAIEIVGKLDDLSSAEASHFLQLVAEHVNLSAKLDTLLGAGGNEGQLMDIQSAIAENSQKIMDVLIAINNLPNILPDIQRLDKVNDDLTGLIACLWIGVLCPDGVPDGTTNLGLMALDLAEILAGIDWAKEDIETILEDLATLKDEHASNVVPTAIELDVTHSDPASGKSQVFLVLSKVHGVPTTAALSVTAAPASGQSGFSLVPVSFTLVELAPGVQQLTVEVDGNLSSTQTFLIIAEIMLAEESFLYGSTLTSTHDQAD